MIINRMLRARDVVELLSFSHQDPVKTFIYLRIKTGKGVKKLNNSTTSLLW